MRLTYFDESGHHSQSTVAVVAGVMINNDQHKELVSNRLVDLKTLVPESLRDNFIFHATKIANGGKLRSDWSYESRIQLLTELCAIPRTFGLPVFLGWCTTKLAPEIELNAEKKSIFVHGSAYMHAIVAADLHMKMYTSPGEYTTIIAEDRREARNYLKFVHKTLTDESDYRDLDCNILPQLTRVHNPPHFADKSEVMLQIADLCAFVFYRILSRSKDHVRLADALLGSGQNLDARLNLNSMPGGYYALGSPSMFQLKAHIWNVKAPQRVSYGSQ
jgi:Protein of unknown function (DUF3800)